VGLALLFFVPFLGIVHLFDWNEIRAAECAREMLVTGNYFCPQINFQLFWEMPPGFLWMQAISMKLFGIGAFAARFPNAICGLLTLLLVYHLGRRLHDQAFGWLWVLAWLGSLLPHLYFRSGIIDPWFNLLIFVGLYSFIEFRWLFFTHFKARNFWHRYRYLLLGGWLLGLAVLINGPVAYVLVLLTLLAYFARYGFRNKGFLKHLIYFTTAAISISLIWFGVEMALHGTGFVQAFLEHQFHLFFTTETGTAGFFGFHVLVLLLGCFPISVFALRNLWGDNQSQDEMLESDTLASCKRSDMATWMQLLFWVVLVFFSLVPTKMVHFSSLAYFPLTYLGTLTIWRALNWGDRPKIVSYALPVLGVLIGLSVLALPLVGQNMHWIKPLVADNAFLTARMNIDLSWHWWQGVPGLVLIVASLASWVYWQKNMVWRAAQTMFTGGAVFVAFTLVLFVENIEKLTQCSTIEFYESKANEACSIQPVGIKSYAHLFYARIQPSTVSQNSSAQNRAEKKVYYVAKCTQLRHFSEQQQCRELYRKDGWVYFEKVAE
jgi:4-amino-4-deoxy-L-arabinose transferase-like glycosyltransferase